VRAAISLAFVLGLEASAQLRDEPVPRCEDFLVKELYSDPIAQPRIIKPEERRYRTAIENGVRKGFGVLHEPEGTEKRGPNFAGHYIVVQWGCGTECLQYAIVDAKDGAIYQPPVPGSHIAYFDSGRLDYRLRSKLMVVKTNCAMGDRERCDRDFYIWENNRFGHLSRIPRGTK
jgi:hypothetical protein